MVGGGMTTDLGVQSVRASVLGADKGFRVIDGGGSGAPRVPVDSDGNPWLITPLGHLDGTFHFLDVKGQKRSLTARQLGSRHDLLTLFLGDEEWLRKNFPKRKPEKSVDEHGQETTVWRTVDFNVNMAAMALQRACGERGLLSDETRMRRPGIWVDDLGQPVVHCGDKIWLSGQWVPAGEQTGNQVWAAAPPIVRPGVPCDASVGRHLQQSLQALWRWRDGGSPFAILGLVCNAFYGAALDWRTAGFITGETGSGKTALKNFLRAVLPLHHYDNDTTKAGVEQAANGRAMPIIIDEASDRANPTAGRDLADMLLSVSSGEGTVGSRGTSDGKGRRIELVGVIIMFSINPPMLEPQHLGRLALLELLKPEGGADHNDEHRALARFARSEGRNLWARALASWARYGEALQCFRAALRAAGCAPREMDQYGALLAGWWILTAEGLPTERDVRIGLSALHGGDLSEPGLIRTAADVEADSRGRRALHYLQSAMVQLDRTTERAPVGRLVEIALGLDAEETELFPGDHTRGPVACARHLMNFGIRVMRQCARIGHPKPPDGCRCVACRDRQGRPVPRMSEQAGVWISTHNQETAKLFKGSPFEGDRWRYDLLRLPSARMSSKKNIRIGGGSGSAIWLSKSDWFDDDGGGDAVTV